MHLLYNLAIYLLTPVLLLHLLWRGLRDPDYLHRWGERFGFFQPPEINNGIVVHAVSVGEVNAAIPLIRGLQVRWPDIPIVVTGFTPTGSARIQEILGDSVFHIYAPLDLPGAVKRFYSRIQPRMLIIMETEIWPNLYRKAAKMDIPVVIANARVSEKSLKGYQMLPRLAAEVLGSVAWAAAQTETDAARLIQCGTPSARVDVTGSLKFDIRVPASLLEEGEIIRLGWGFSRPVLLAASTHEGDVEPILDAFVEVLKNHPDALLVLVPRHPERFGRAAQLAKSHGLVIQLRSETEICNPKTNCFVVDAMGELLRYCAASDVAFVGGSFAPLGGHNVLEPAALGKPVLFGPHMFNFAEISARLKQRGAALEVADAEQLAAAVSSLFSDPNRCDQMGRAGLRLVSEGRGALSRNLDQIEKIL
jgi:3-deoxy-D-manno-octulosonic-acid transferase